MWFHVFSLAGFHSFYKALLSRRFASQLALLDLMVATLTVGQRAARPGEVGITTPLHRGSTAHGQQRLLKICAAYADWC